MPMPAQGDRANRKPVDFTKVLHDELDFIKARRRAVFADDQAAQPPADASPTSLPEGEAQEHALNKGLVGLAFSGGGIRSASFNLGVLQALADLDLLKRIDYLSTVSGGGFIGSWLMAWIKREGDPANVERQLKVSRVDQAWAKRNAIRVEPNQVQRPPLVQGEVKEEEPEPIRHLRTHSSYLSPKLGLLSADVWALGALYLRNLLLHQLVLLPAVLSVLLLTRLVFCSFNPAQVQGWWDAVWAAYVIAGLTLFGFFWIIRSLWVLREIGEGQEGKKIRWQLGRRGLHLCIFWPLLIVAMVVCRLVVTEGTDPYQWTWVPTIGAHLQAWEDFLLNWGWTLPLAVGVSGLVVRLSHLRRAARALAGGAGGHPAAAFGERFRKEVWLIGAAVLILLAGVAGALLQCRFVSLPWSPHAFPWPRTLLVVGLFAGFHVWFLLVFSAAAGGWQHLLARLAVGVASGLVVAGLLVALPVLTPHFDQWFGRIPGWRAALLYGFFCGLFHSLGYLYYALVNLGRFFRRTENWSPKRMRPLETLWQIVGWLTASFVTGYVGGVLLYLLGDAIDRHGLKGGSDEYERALALAATVTFGPPLILLIFVLVNVLQVGLLRKYLLESGREWLGTLSGQVLVYAVCYVGIFGSVLYGGWLLLEAGPWLQAVLGASWVSAALAGILAGRSPLTGGGRGRNPLEPVARIAPYLFLLGLLALLSWLVGVGVNQPPDRDAVARDVAPERVPREPATKVTQSRRLGSGGVEVVRVETQEYTEQEDVTTIRRRQFWRGLLKSDKFVVLGWLMGALFLTLIMAGLVDVNTFSLHAVYGNRLVRCFLGASRPKAPSSPWGILGAPIRSDDTDVVRQPNPITGFDLLDDLPLRVLTIGPSAAMDHGKAYWGPYPIINTALNLVHAEELAWQERKAESFVLTPRYCGSKSTGYQCLNSDERHLTLGRAVTISGAAASPNMGYHSSPAVTALLTVFNVRLGAWVRNPAPSGLDAFLGRWQGTTWSPTGPPFGLLHVGYEMFGRTDARSRYLYLSDGGHFENLGVYELIRRRCRYVIACDAGADPGYQFEDLGGMIRKCRNDFGIRIDLDLSPLRPQGTGRRSLWHCALGVIHYEDVDDTAIPGLLVYLKASLTGDEPSDVQQYAAAHATFPHQTTADQFFTESQFESYRGLGHHAARMVFADAAGQMRADDPRWGASAARPRTTDQTLLLERKLTKTFFGALRRRWFPPPPDHEKSFLESVKAFLDVQEDMLTDNLLRPFSSQMYPELASDLRRRMEGFAAREHRPAWRWLALELDRFLAGKVSPVEGGWDFAAEVSPACAELHMVSQLLQVMENAWLEVRLEAYHAHPLNRGWMNVFHRWAGSPVVRRHWPTLRGEYSQDFVDFCERQLALPVARSRPIRVDPQAPAVRRALDNLAQEFGREWQEEATNLNRWRELTVHLGAQPAFVPVAPLFESLEDLKQTLGREAPAHVPGVRTFVERIALSQPFAWPLQVMEQQLDQLEQGLAPVSEEHRRKIRRLIQDTVWPRLGLGAQPLVWLIPVAREEETPEWSDASHACGMILVWPVDGANGQFEWLVWMRGPYRNLGIARQCVDAVLEQEIWTKLVARQATEHKAQDFTLRVRYPLSRRRGGSDRLEREMWLSFYYDYGFRRKKRSSGVPGPDLLLERNYEAWRRRQEP